MNLWKELRLYILAITFFVGISTLGKRILAPVDKSIAFSFPNEVALHNWQSLASEPLTNIKGENFNSVAGKHYQYISNNQKLTIETRYLVSTNGDTQQLIEKSSLIPSFDKSLLVNRYSDKVGFYSLFSHNKRAYLSACINPRGGSTVTSEQFTDNRNTYDLQINRLVPWLLGKEDLRDWRCLWTLVSIPMIKSSTEATYPVLEEAWISWYNWWVPRFPPR
ncbi:MAG TPA: cyanoexosortase A system-associated protein [Oculatellaceae cyanobacterium]|jgi:cyanosortase A-associated protein